MKKRTLPSQPKISKFSSRIFKTLFFIFACYILASNTVGLILDTIRIQKQKKAMPFYFLGFKFLGLEKVLSHVPYIGYYTDKNMNIKQNSAQFSEAQYLLAPTILDFNNTDHEFILFDCTSEKAAMQKIKEIHAVPLKRATFSKPDWVNCCSFSMTSRTRCRSAISLFCKTSSLSVL